MKELTSDQFTKHGQLFVLPCYLNGDTVIVPKEHASTIANAPDSELDPYPVADEYMQEDYTLTIRPNEAIIIETIRKHLTGKSLEAMFPTIQEEVRGTHSKPIPNSSLLFRTSLC